MLICIGCEPGPEIAQLDTKDGDPHQNLTEIEVMEIENGVPFYKEQLTLMDSSGKNKVIMLVASKNEDLLKDYLSVVKYTIEPTFKKITKQLDQPSPSFDEEAGTTSYDGIITEFISQELEKGAVGFRTHVKFDKEGIMDGARFKGYDYANQQIHVSMNWPEVFLIYAHFTVGYKLESKENSCCFQKWKLKQFCDWDAPLTCNTYWTQYGGTYRYVWIDGPYKTRAIVDYDNFTDYSFEFQDHEAN